MGLLLGNSFWKKFHDAIAEAVRALVPYSEVLHIGFVKRPCDSNLVFFSCVLDTRRKACEKNEVDLLIKCLLVNKQLHDEIGSENLIIFNFAKLVMYVHHSEQN